jgi:prepilin signal peptidase PulO-like enzyme (type II secretory pathway)
MTDLFLSIIIFIFGLVVGSFLNCVIYRFETNGNFLKGRSFCPHCKHILGWQDLIPVFSFLILRGKCRYCHQKISWQYPLVELATGVLFAFSFSVVREPISLIFYWTIISFLIVIFVYDLKRFLIPDKIIYPAIGIAFIFNLLNSYVLNHESFLNPLISAFGAAGFFLAIILISRGKWMGLGDVKLAFFMGLFLGWPAISVALFSAFLLGAVIGLTLIILGKKTFESEVPFGPFLSFGTVAALFLSNEFIGWYLNLFY